MWNGSGSMVMGMQGSVASLEARDDNRLPAYKPPIDRAHLARFTFGDTDLEIEVLGLFADQALLTLADLERAGTPKDWRNSAHTLKGSARVVGAWRVATVAERAEQEGLPASETKRSATVALLADAIVEARAYIAALDR